MSLESDLNLRVADIKARLGRFSGWGSDSTIWSTEQQAIIQDAVDSGLRRFYYPTPLDQPSMAGYEWSFLKPLISLTFPKGAQQIQLPQYYTAIASAKVTLQPTGVTTQPFEIQWTNEGKIRELYSVTSNQTGPPMFVSIQVQPGVGTDSGQIFSLYFFPIADQDYTVQTTVSVAPNTLNGAAPFAWGGPAHAETILESCLAIMEERLDDMPAGSGPHSVAFQARLAASMVMDRRNKAPRLGYVGDRSDERYRSFPINPWWAAGPGLYNSQSLDP